MSSSDENEEDTTSHETEVTVSLTTYTLTKPKTKKAVAVLKKDTGTLKTKSIQFAFIANEDNHILLMNTLLTTMGLTQYKATKKRPFCMKMAIPPKKTYVALAFIPFWGFDIIFRKGQGSDVESTLEYIAQAAKIIESKTNATVFVWIDGKEILESCRKLMRNSAGSDNDENGDEFDDDDSSMSPMEQELARMRIILEKQHGNDYDLTYTYIDPTTAKKFALSPNAIDEWTRAIYSGLADKFRPPSNDDSPNFGAANRQSSIQPFGTLRSSSAHHHQPAPAAVNPGEKSNLAHFATIMSMIIPPRPMQSPIPSSSSLAPLLSPAKNTPTKLRRFLEYAESDAGVKNATYHLFALENKGYGPDILECVEDKDLRDLGIKHGDAMCLKRAAPIWFNGPEAKRKQPLAPLAQPDQHQNRTRFEKRWINENFVPVIDGL
ncbi:hypothetical protein F5876DRAFT_69870 [Lentinula aff. lateritia]|uniref:Uncharacterized protein n=1 Tax=Lentinula aff. lateritia TaxID=2804960 RepID=A0ACC1TLA1_9AGAR|nr:hypothetical protein F5876DRAFT_69870 [Lentinula aff. lateritia]